jgi:hypothetical protein
MAESSRSKTLIVCYSRTGTAQAAADKLKDQLGCDAESVTYAARKAKPSFLGAILETMKKKTCEIRGDDKNPGEYDRVIIITPVWGASLTTPIRSYLKKHGPSIASYSLLYVLSKDGNPEMDAAEAAGKGPAVTVMLLSSQIKGGQADYAALAASLTI